MGRTQLAKASIAELEKRIVIAEARKKDFVEHLWQLHWRHERGEISYLEYAELVHQKIGGRSNSEWIEYYTNYINNCKKLISIEKKKILKHNLFITLSLFMSFVLIFFIFNSNLVYVKLTGLTGLFSEEISEEVPLEDLSPSQEDLPTSEPEIPKNISEEISEEVPLEDLSPSQEDLPTPEEIPVTILTNISTIQSKIVIGKPVKWIKIIEFETLDGDFSMELPKEAKNISVKTRGEIPEALLELENYENLIETVDRGDLISGLITGNIVSDIKNSQGILTRFLRWLKGFTITGNLIQESELQEEIIETVDGKLINISQIAIQTQETKIAVEYYTEGPIAVEVETKRGKRVTVSAPDELNYIDVLTFTEIPEVYEVGEENKIKIYWREENKFVEFTAQDLDGNGKLDYIEWNTPYFSTQTFEIILITKAEHLDSNREFISDIFEEVKELDNVWSEEIPANDYVRVTFEQNLTNENDITIYPRVISGNPRIEVYEFEGTEIIAEFTNINSNEYNQVLFPEFEGYQDTFDLRVIGGSVEIDHIIDPAQFARPDNDFATGSWSTTEATFFDAVNEITANDDTDYVSSTTDEDELDLNITDLTDPNLNTSHIIQFVAKAFGTGGKEKAEMHLFQGSTEKATTGSVNIDRPAYQTLTYTLSEAEAESITDYTDLFLRLHVHVLSGGESMRVTQMEFQVPEAAGDDPPQWFDNSTNGTVAGTYIEHSVNWTDDTALSGYIFEFDNGTGTFTNDSFVSFSGVQNWSNVSKVVNSTVGSTIRWRVYANDSINQFNSTDLFQYNTTSAPVDNPPTWSQVSANESTPDTNDLVSHDVNWSDDTALSYATLEVNGTGANCDTLSNVSSTSLSGLTQFANLTWQVPNECEGKVIGWRQYANDSANQWNSTDIQQYTVNNINPIASFGTNPVDDLNSTSNSITFDLKVSDNLGVDFLELYANWSGSWIVNQTNSSAVNDTIWSITVQEIPDGLNHVWGVFGNDTLGNFDFTDTNRTLNVDTTAPSLSNANANETAILQNEFFCVNVTATDSTSGLDTILAELNDTTGFVNYTMTDTGSGCGGGAADNVFGVDIQAVNAGNWTYEKVYGNDTFGNLNVFDFANIFINVTSSNNPPTIPFVFTNASYNPLESTTRSITFNFTAEDLDGAGDLNDSTAEARFQRSGETTRLNTSCINAGSSGNQANYTCTVDMWYFDLNGDWTINVTIQDNAEASAENSSTTFQYNILTAMVMAPTDLGWPSPINVTDTNTGSNNDPIIVNNTGNDENLNINITGLDLQGEDTPTQYIFAENFTVENTSEGCSGTAMVNDTSTNVTSVILQRGNNSLNFANATSGQEELFFCLIAVNADLTAQSYSSAAFGTWEIIVLSVSFLVVVGTKSRNKNKSKKKKKKENKLIEALDLLEYLHITDKLKDKLHFTDEEIIKTVVDKLSKKYKINREEFLGIIKAREGITIPITIFSEKLGALESIVKYMRENLDMNYREIAKELGRNERTIWTAYKKANEKMKEKIEAEKTDTKLPISIFENKELTVLESVIVYLKESGMKYSEIAELLNRDQRNVWTIYSRAIKKLNNEKE